MYTHLKPCKIQIIVKRKFYNKISSRNWNLNKIRMNIENFIYKLPSSWYYRCLWMFVSKLKITVCNLLILRNKLCSLTWTSESIGKESIARNQIKMIKGERWCSFYLREAFINPDHCNMTASNSNFEMFACLLRSLAPNLLSLERTRKYLRHNPQLRAFPISFTLVHIRKEYLFLLL